MRNTGLALTAGLAVAVTCLPGFPGTAFTPALLSAQGRAATSLFVDVGITDDNGRTVTSLKPEDLRIKIGGAPATIASLRYVFRGPGSDTAAGLADPARDAPAAAERRRAVLVVVDETNIFRGQEKAVVAAAMRILDELTASDQAAVVSLPGGARQIHLTSVSTDRLAGLAHIVGRAALDSRLDEARADSNLREIQETRERSAVEARNDPDEAARQTQQQAAMQEQRMRTAAETAEERTGTEPLTTAGALVPMVAGFIGLPGPKTVVVLQQGDTPPESRSADRRRRDVDALVEVAARARAAVHLVTVGGARKKDSGTEDMRAVAAATGGTITTAKQANDVKAFDALRAALAGAYLVEVVPAAPAAAGKPLALHVETTRRKVAVRAGQWCARRDDPVPVLATAAASAPAAPAGVAPGAPAPSAAPIDRGKDATLALLLAKMTEYLTGYIEDFGNVVAEEQYVQEITSDWRVGPRLRVTKADILLVRTSDNNGWLQYRDVFEVDGKPVRDRQERVQKLFLEAPGSAAEQSQAISNESARYNIGDLGRTINVPTLALALLSPAYIGGLDFVRHGEETIEGIRTARVTFEEMHRPTLVRQTDTKRDAPSSGVVWIDPSNGRVVRTQVTVTAGVVSAQATVTFRPGGLVGIWTPAEMSEVYKRSNYTISCRARYSNFRSFKVTTDLTIAK